MIVFLGLTGLLSFTRIQPAVHELHQYPHHQSIFHQNCIAIHHVLSLGPHQYLQQNQCIYLLVFLKGFHDHYHLQGYNPRFMSRINTPLPINMLPKLHSHRSCIVPWQLSIAETKTMQQFDIISISFQHHHHSGGTNPRFMSYINTPLPLNVLPKLHSHTPWFVAWPPSIATTELMHLHDGILKGFRDHIHSK